MNSGQNDNTNKCYPLPECNNLSTKVVVTGFTKFLNFSSNPSEDVVEYIRENPISDCSTQLYVLPVSYRGVSGFCQRLFEKPDIAAVILLGLNHRIDHVALEQRAINLQRSVHPDAEGEVRSNSIISKNGSLEIDTNLDLIAIAEKLSRPSNPVKVSLYAGSYICNSLYYQVLEKAEKGNIPCVFVHLPLFSKQWTVKNVSELISALIKEIGCNQNKYLRRSSKLKTQKDAEEYLYSFINYERKTGVVYSKENYNLDRFADFLAEAGHPELNQNYIHIAGTKGKGSVSAIVASILSAHGYRTGLFTSPHLLDIRERIRIDGKAISQKDFVSEIGVLQSIVDKSEREFENCYRTTFELLTAAAFQYFSKMHPDWIVLETGMGGRLDCTNVIKPVITAITRIDKDHTDTLGNKFAQICREKSGIAKAGVPMILGQQLPRLYETLNKYASNAGTVPERAGSTIKFSHIDHQSTCIYFDARIQCKWMKQLKLNLPGVYQLENCRTALAIIQKLAEDGKITMNEDSLRSGLEMVQYAGRFTVIESSELGLDSDNCKIIIDGAHNPRAFKAVLKGIAQVFPDKKLIAVVGIASNKDVKLMINLLHDANAELIATTYDSPRATDAEELGRIAEGFSCLITVQADLDSSLKWLNQQDISGKVVLITGSIYLAGEAMQKAGRRASCLNIY